MKDAENFEFLVSDPKSKASYEYVFKNKNCIL